MKMCWLETLKVFCIIAAVAILAWRCNAIEERLRTIESHVNVIEVPSRVTLDLFFVEEGGSTSRFFAEKEDGDPTVLAQFRRIPPPFRGAWAKNFRLRFSGVESGVLPSGIKVFRDCVIGDDR